MHIAIIGCGIGGLTTALTLQRMGLKVSLFEQAEQLREVGGGVQLNPQAVQLLRSLGLDMPLRSVAIRPTVMEVRRWEDGRVLFYSPLGDECEREFGAPYYVVHRGELQRILLEAIPGHIIHLGYRCLAVKSRPDGVDLTFANGLTVTADVAIGADGIHSVLRDALFSSQIHFSGLSAYRSLVPAEQLPFLTEDLRLLYWWGPGQHFVCYPVSHGQLINFVGIVPVDNRNIESWSAPGRVEDFLAFFSGWDELMLKIIGTANTVLRWDLYDCDPLECWSDQRITLLGDAAHPMLPFASQGAAQAIEDAWILASCLKDATHQTVAAEIRRYEAIRKPRTARLQLLSRRNGDIHNLPDGEEQRQRDTELATHNGQSLAWLYGWL